MQSWLAHYDWSSAGNRSPCDPTQAKDKPDYVPNEVLMQLAQPTDLAAVADQYNLRFMPGGSQRHR
jgi:hypothetical protein